MVPDSARQRWACPHPRPAGRPAVGRV